MTILHWYSPISIIFLGIALLLSCQAVLFIIREHKTLLDYARLLLLLSFSISFVFVQLHLSYANLFLVLAQASVIFLIVAFIRDRFFVNKSKSIWTPISEILYGLAYFGILVGALLKILHYMYSNTLLLVGICAAILSQLLPSGKEEN